MSQPVWPMGVRDFGVRTHSATAPTAGSMRWVRGSVVGFVASAVAWLGHSLAAGMRPDPAAMLWTAALGAPVAIALSGRRWRLPSLLTVLLGAQVAFHVAFADMSHAAGTGHAAMAGSMAHGASSGHGLLLAVDLGHPGAAMVLAHVAAALVTAVVLRRGEDWCWALLELLAGPLAMLGTTPVELPRLRHPAVPRLQNSGHLVFLADSQPRRGPPCPVA